MEFEIEKPIDRTGFDEIHVHDWPLVVFNGLRQTLDMAADDPRRQDYCSWCRGFGGQRVFVPDVCPGCRGTCLVSVRQQYFLMDRMYHRLDDIIYPDWPIWIERKNPILGSKSGQWNNLDPVMSARGRIVEIRFDEERRRNNPALPSRIQFPSPEVEEVFKEMKFPRRYFPPKPETPVRISSRFFPRNAPEHQPIRIFVHTSEEIKKLSIKPYKLAAPKPYDCYKPYAKYERKSDDSDKRSEETTPEMSENGRKNPDPSENGAKNPDPSDSDAKNSSWSEKDPKISSWSEKDPKIHSWSEKDPKNFPWSEKEAKYSFSSSEQTSNADPSETDTKNWFTREMEPKHLQYELLDRFKTLKHQEHQMQDALRMMREERHVLSSKLNDPNLAREELMRGEECLMAYQEKIVSLQRELAKVVGALSAAPLPASENIPEVAQCSGEGEAIVTPSEMSAPEIRFTQVRSFVVRRSKDECDWDVGGRCVKLAGERYLDGKVDGLLTAEDVVVGMTLASDQAMFNLLKVRSDSRMKIVRDKNV